MKRILIPLLLFFAAGTVLSAQDADSLKFRTVSMGVLLQANYSGESMYIAESSLYAYPGFGVEGGGFIDYHITRRLAVEVQALVVLQSGRYVSASGDPGFKFFLIRRGPNDLADMRLWGMDIPVFLTYSFPVRTGSFRVGAGLYTHITFSAWCPGMKDFITPYRRVISIDEATGKPKYALNDAHAGLGLTFGYEFASGLQLNFSAKHSVIDIINYKSETSHALPYKLTLGLGWRF
ncbi:MAG: outer membrane beta-barrel protein [Bacteroidales bacterium]|nr:outer membrane beta-barrel protein [Bacteroidales bacterium]